MQIVAVNPFRCRMWPLHPRIDENITEKSCQAQIESIEKHGQLVPALGRRLGAGADHDLELIYGARRLFVARHLNQPLLVEVRDIADRDAIIAMDIENRLRQDISAYERALGYARWLREGYFQSQDEIARALQVSPPHVSRLLRLASLPLDIIDAFGSAVEVCEEWGVNLANLLKNPDQERKLVRAASRIASLSPRPSAADVYSQLCSAACADSCVRAADERIVKDEDGTALFRVKYRRDSIMLVLPLEMISKASLRAIELSVTRIMDAQVPNRPAAVATTDMATIYRGAHVSA